MFYGDWGNMASACCGVSQEYIGPCTATGGLRPLLSDSPVHKR